MSRSNQQLVRLIQNLVHLVKSGRLSGRWLFGFVAVAIIYLLLQPILVRSLGIDLPGFSDLAEISTESPTTNPSEQPDSPTATTSADLDRILTGKSRQTYHSAAGLRYARGSQHGHRLKHLMAHTTDQPNRPGQHGVFDEKEPHQLVALVDEVYTQAVAGKGVSTKQEEQRTVYTVDLGRRIGFIGGESGNRRNRPSAKHVRLVIEDRDFITAFPYLP